MWLRTLNPWIQTWASEGIFAAVTGRGAIDGWYKTAIPLELYKLNGDPFARGAVDIMRGFDQIYRGLLYRLAQKTGMPLRVLRAYQSYHESLKAYNTIARALGQPYTKPSSIL